MKRFAFYIIFTLFSFNCFCESIVISSVKTDSENPFVNHWIVNYKSNKVYFKLNNEIKSEMALNDSGQITQITIFRKFQGKTIPFVIDKPKYIHLELNSNYYPFKLAHSYKTKKLDYFESDNTRFKVIEVKK